jgi:hypothetical protein
VGRQHSTNHQRDERRLTEKQQDLPPITQGLSVCEYQRRHKCGNEAGIIEEKCGKADPARTRISKNSNHSIKIGGPPPSPVEADSCNVFIMAHQQNIF